MKMLFPTPNLLLLLAAVLKTAAASSDSLSAASKRQCSGTYLPSLITTLSQSHAATSYPNTHLTTDAVTISQSAGGTNEIAALLAFPPAPSTANICTLHLTFPPNYPPTIIGPAAPTLNIYTVQQPLPASPTWNNVVLSSGVFGTVTVAAGQSVTINSQVCPQTTGHYGAAFVFKYADWITAEGSVGWTEYVNALNGAGLRGAYLTFDC